MGNELIFKCRGPFAEAEIRRTESDGSMEFINKQDNNKIIQGEFSKKFRLFYKMYKSLYFYRDVS